MAEYYIGLMSGTSMDALDAVLVDLKQDTPQLIANLSNPLPASLRRQLLELAVPGDNEIDRCARADRLLGEYSATTVLELLGQAGVDAKAVHAVGSHGQTVRHAPQSHPSYTVQIGDGNTIAQQCGITTVNDFRRRDMVVGGEGAPLVPAFHNALYRDNTNERVVLNLGGIANITILPIDPAEPISGFDTGPANVLMDGWTQLHRGEPYDHDGKWAATGSVDTQLLETLLTEPYFQRPAPKSTGREHFNLEWLQRQLPDDLDPADVQATLCELTARSIAEAINSYSPWAKELIVCGGGAYNGQLMHRLAANLDSLEVRSSAEHGVEPRWVEAMAFAWLAQRTLQGLPGNAPTVTGAREAVILGAIHPAH